MAAKRQRDYKAEYARRQAKAKQLGYGSYYERRVGAVPKGQRARARGHRGRSDFLSIIRPGDLILLVNQVSAVKRDEQGRYIRIDKQLIPASGGPARYFTLRNLTRAALIETIDAEMAAGAIFSPAPSLDQRRLVNV